MSGDSRAPGSSAPGSSASGGGVSRSRAVPFAVIPGYRPLKLDLYRPTSEQPLPAVVYLHGGGWRQGARHAASPAFRDWRPGLLTRLASAGRGSARPGTLHAVEGADHVRQGASDEQLHRLLGATLEFLRVSSVRSGPSSRVTG